MSDRAVVLDLDDTLIVDEGVSHEAFLSTAEEARRAHGAEPKRFLRVAQSEARRLWAEGSCLAFCREIGISAFECLWGRFEGKSPQLTALRDWAHPFRKLVFDSALREQKIEDPQGGCGLAAHFESARRKLQRLMPDARETLARLQPTHKRALLTNGAPDLQREKIAASGLESCFDAIIVSGEFGIGKPKPEVFQYALSLLGVDASQAVMVGNSLERDIAGARRAGLRSVWIQVPGAEEHADVQPDATITGLIQLPKVLERL